MPASILYKFLPTQPDLTSAGTPQQLTTDDIIVKSVLIEAGAGNTGAMYIADSSDNATSTKGHSLDPGISLSIDGNVVGAESKAFNLSKIWFDGATTNNVLVVSYLD